MVGRANRISPGKTAAEVAEIVDLHSKRSVTVPQLFGFPPQFDCEGHDFVECCDLADQLLEEHAKKDLDKVDSAWSPYFCRSWSAMQLANAEEYEEEQEETVEYDPEDVTLDSELDKTIEELIESEARYAFVELEQDGFDQILFGEFVDRRQGLKSGVFVLREEGGDAYQVQMINPDTTKGLSGPVADSEDYAVRWACAWVRHNFANVDMLYNLSADWRTHDSTLKQRQALKRAGLVSEGQKLQELTKGSASELLNEHFVRQSFSKYVPFLRALSNASSGAESTDAEQ